jgi:hypothetical protein
MSVEFSIDLNSSLLEQHMDMLSPLKENAQVVGRLLCPIQLSNMLRITTMMEWRSLIRKQVINSFV